MLYTFVPVLLLRTLIAGSALSIMVACAAEPVAPSAQASASLPPPSTVELTVLPSEAEPEQLSFAEWRNRFRSQALNAGISAQVFRPCLCRRHA